MTIKTNLSETQIVRWISVKSVALNLLGEEPGELDSNDDGEWNVFKIKHKCYRNIDSLPDHPIILTDTSWHCERGPMMKMINIENNALELVISVMDCTTLEAIKWINQQIEWEEGDDESEGLKC